MSEPEKNGEQNVGQVSPLGRNPTDQADAREDVGLRDKAANPTYGIMAGEWRHITLGEFVSLQRGHDLTEPERKPGTFPVMGSAGQNGFHDTALAKSPGIVIGRSGASFGQVHYCPVDYWPHNTTLYVTDFHGNDPRFAYYFLKSINFARYNSGSAQPSLNRNFIYPIEVNVPQFDKQRAIAHILGTLDDKIELNRRMNETLEAIARAIFKSWFVDFDPVRAKASGEPPESICRRLGLTPDLLALFPDRFVDSELGEIPEGWEVRYLNEVANINYGTNLPATSMLDSGVPVYGAAGIVGYYSETMFSEPVILVTSRGSGSGVVHETDGPAFITNNSFTVVPIEKWFSRHLLRSLLLHADIAAYVTGSAQPQLTITNFQRLQLLLPSQDTVRAFHGFVDSLWMKAAGNRIESKTLSRVRDTLLPKLLSGELRVPTPTEGVA